jgi:radical SAM superfamily enzyme YgiQ (UPF0313 family)
MNNLLIVNLPKYDLNAPCAATAALMGVAYDNDYKPYESDFNVYLHKNLSSKEWYELDLWPLLYTISNALKTRIIELWNKMINDNLPLDCKFLCISIFSYDSLHISKLILEEENKKIKNYKIIVGGNGASSTFTDTGMAFSDWAVDGGYVDHLVSGDGESTFASILTDGVNEYDLDDLDTIPYPEYSEFDYDDYSERKIYITSSRGCVRRCTYCDVNEIWPQFRYRDAQSIVNEIKKHFYETGITDYDFTDSLINGSSSNFFKFNTLLAEEKEKTPDLRDIRYRGQSICKTRKSMPEEHFEAMHYAGCQQLTTGIESFSEQIRTDMRKKFTNDDLDYYLEQCGRWGIPNIFLMLVGYPTETEENHRENCEGLHKYKKYSDSGVIELIRFGTTMKIVEGTPIAHPDMFNKLGLSFDEDYRLSDINFYWNSSVNPTNTLIARIRRRVELHEICVKLNYPQPRIDTELSKLKELAKTIINKKDINIQTI